MKMTRRSATRLAALLLACALSGCPAPEDETVFFEEDFETTCEGTPCGWTQITGPDDAARYVETLPGDHGLELVGDDVTVRGATDEAVNVFSDQLAVRAVARCDAGALLDVRAAVEVRGGRTATFEASILPSSTWSSALPDETLRPLDLPAPWELTRVLGVSVRKTGTGSCEIDYLALRSVRRF